MITSRGAACLVDEQGLLVATSAGDPLYRREAGVLQRSRLDHSRNFDRLAPFREFDDEELTPTLEVISLFRADAAQKLLAIEQAVDAHDAKALSWASHAMAGAAGNVGAVAMQAVGNALEVQVRSGVTPENARQEIERLQTFWLKTRALLDAWL